jgi:hypothetical protein
MFGYVGDTFWAEANQSITPQQTISVAANLSAKFGAQNIRFVNPVDVEPGHNIQPQMVQTIGAYVDNLRRYSSVVYGRIDALQFSNLSSMYSEASLFVKQLHVNGIFIDLAPVLYNNIGQTTFNKIIQNLTNSFPGLNYIMNEAATSSDYITPLSGTTWGSSTFVMPTVSSGQYTYGGISNLSKIIALNKIFPGHVLMHYDANAGLGKGEPMAVFADQSTSNEISALTTLIQNGLTPPTCPSSDTSLCKFDFLIPVLGAWTANDSAYSGTLYNSFSFGKYARGTFDNFMGIIQSNYVMSASLGAQDFAAPSVSSGLNNEMYVALTFAPLVLCLLACFVLALQGNNQGLRKKLPLTLDSEQILPEKPPAQTGCFRAQNSF